MHNIPLPVDEDTDVPRGRVAARVVVGGEELVGENRDGRLEAEFEYGLAVRHVVQIDEFAPRGLDVAIYQHRRHLAQWRPAAWIVDVPDWDWIGVGRRGGKKLQLLQLAFAAGFRCLREDEANGGGLDWGRAERPIRHGWPADDAKRTEKSSLRRRVGRKGLGAGGRACDIV